MSSSQELRYQMKQNPDGSWAVIDQQTGEAARTDNELLDHLQRQRAIIWWKILNELIDLTYH